MSTVPGAQSWRDAGLVPAEPQVPARLTDDPGDEPAPEPEQYVPDFPRPDLEGQATEADVVEQAIEVPVDDDGDARD